MLNVICAAVLLYATEKDFKVIPPIVYGTLVNESMKNGKDYFWVRFKDLEGNTRTHLFEANTCKFRNDSDR